MMSIVAKGVVASLFLLWERSMYFFDDPVDKGKLVMQEKFRSNFLIRKGDRALVHKWRQTLNTHLVHLC